MAAMTEVQRHDAFLLGLVRPVVDAALGMREHGPGEGMSRLALVEPRLALHPVSGRNTRQFGGGISERRNPRA